MTVISLPAFVTHNEASSDFTILKNSDLSLIGNEYTVTLKSEICIPDDYTNASCTKMASEFDFKIII